MAREINTETALELNLKRWGKFEDRYDFALWQETHDSGKTLAELCGIFKIARATLKKAVELGLFVKNKYKITEITKKKLSAKRKQWLEENPEKHPWKRKDKFVSSPCENVKSYFKAAGVEFVEEFSPEINGRFFSIDIALPDKMIAIEINGNQHYEKGGLTQYYQERHDLLVAVGWEVYEVKYHSCFNQEKWSQFISELQKQEKRVEFDYFKYSLNSQESKKLNICVDCGKVIKKQSTYCRKCARVYSVKYKICWPDDASLQKMLWAEPMTCISKLLKVSDVAIKKRAKKRGLTIPPVGYWIKISNSTTDA